MLFVFKQDVALVYAYMVLRQLALTVKRGPSKKKLLLSYKCQ